ncbi:MAG TPA: hypothetical protein VE622_04795 [Nitrososphaeraceae archaeon]|jgi:hypothetical protein|nr:hypothetical protein [Nitrososphaeraceae archaeon]
MEILEGKVLAKYLFEKYSLNPKNWNFIVSTSSPRSGFFDATVSNTDEVWQLKIDSIYKPLPIVLGTKVDLDSTKIEERLRNGNNTVPFGYRKLETPLIMNIFKKLTEEQEPNSPKLDVNSYLNTILGSLETVRPISGEDYAYGPFIFTERNSANSNEYQKQIADKLAFKLRDNLRKMYSSYG